MYVIYQGRSLEIHCPGFLLGAGHTDTLCLACTKIPDSQSINHIIYTNTLGTIRHSYHLRTSHINVGNCLPARILAKGQPYKQPS